MLLHMCNFAEAGVTCFIIDCLILEQIVAN